ncbi:uncharacterized protein LOC131960726 isoform X2 [Centropristis striata]|uniref:uncharacterized protein LOC131960726 isoform X2 n=1 Tax=Centropristis striata TaxID=184440 RepID=UPI0027E122B3|nr:uncharacterized protein LOC131960726 isoform X2 [Centropristis striata]
MRLPRLSALLCGQFGAFSRPPPGVVSRSQTATAPPRRRRRESFAAKSSEVTRTHSSNRDRVMPSNVEIKARVSDPARFGEKAAELSQSEGTIIRQHDTFFNCSQGRLKLRDFMNESGQLIFYERPDTDGPKLSRYSISPTNDPTSLKTVLSDALGVKGQVRKERRLFLIGQTRVHLDTVEGLGDYMELEVVMRPEQTVEEGQKVAEELMEKLGVSKESLVTGAYMDLILKGHKET